MEAMSGSAWALVHIPGEILPKKFRNQVGYVSTL